jgi:uncharacterized protein (TIGR02391 family)
MDLFVSCCLRIGLLGLFKPKASLKEYIMSTVCNLIPNVEDFLVLEAAEIGGVILQVLESQTSRDRTIRNRNNFLLGDTIKDYPRDKHNEVKKLIMEGWAWLEAEGLIAADPEQQGEWIFVTRRGKIAASTEGFRAFRSSAVLNKEMLHPKIVEKCWGAFLRGDYDSAVFSAFREVEIRVRELSGLPQDIVGTDLMRKAFGGKLAPEHLPKAEQESLSHIFAGAIGWFKNPLSHRHVGINQIHYAVQTLMFASHLLYLTETMHLYS